MRAAILLSAFSIILSSPSVTVTGAKERFVVPTEIRGVGRLPQCEHPGVLSKISNRFDKASRKYRNSDLTLEKIEDIRETEFVGNPSDQTDRRFCSAKAYLTDGTHPAVYYLIQEHHSVASIRWGVEFCVSGHDPERAHGADCRSLRDPY